MDSKKIAAVILIIISFQYSVAQFSSPLPLTLPPTQPQLNKSLNSSLNLKFLAEDTIYVPTDFSTIQEAIDNAQEGQVIKVSPGVYQEQIVLKPYLTLLGSGAENTTIESTSGPVILGKPHSKVIGFTIINYSDTWALDCFLADYFILENNIIKSNGPILNMAAAYSQIRNNQFLSLDPNKNVSGILNGGYIIENNYFENLYYAISGGQKEIKNNLIVNCYVAIKTNSTIKYNTIINCEWGIYNSGTLKGVPDSIIYNKIYIGYKSRDHQLRMWSGIVSNNLIMGGNPDTTAFPEAIIGYSNTSNKSEFKHNLIVSANNCDIIWAESFHLGYIGKILNNTFYGGKNIIKLLEETDRYGTHYPKYNIINNIFLNSTAYAIFNSAHPNIEQNVKYNDFYNNNNNAYNLYLDTTNIFLNPQLKNIQLFEFADAVLSGSTRDSIRVYFDRYYQIGEYLEINEDGIAREIIAKNNNIITISPSLDSIPKPGSLIKYWGRISHINPDFHLTENSPCIDAGDPSLPRDPDLTISDIGAFYFHQDNPGGANLTFSSDSIDLGKLQFGKSKTVKIPLINDGFKSLNIDSIKTQNSSFSIADTVRSIAPLDTVYLQVNIQSNNIEKNSDTLKIFSNSIGSYLKNFPMTFKSFKTNKIATYNFLNDDFQYGLTYSITKDSLTYIFKTNINQYNNGGKEIFIEIVNTKDHLNPKFVDTLRITLPTEYNLWKFIEPVMDNNIFYFTVITEYEEKTQIFSYQLNSDLTLQYLGKFTTDEYVVAYSATLFDNYIWLCTDSEELYILDKSDPSSLRIVNKITNVSNNKSKLCFIDNYLVTLHFNQIRLYTLDFPGTLTNPFLLSTKYFNPNNGRAILIGNKDNQLLVVHNNKAVYPPSLDLKLFEIEDEQIIFKKNYTLDQNKNYQEAADRWITHYYLGNDFIFLISLDNVVNIFNCPKSYPEYDNLWAGQIYELHKYRDFLFKQGNNIFILSKKDMEIYDLNNQINLPPQPFLLFQPKNNALIDSSSITFVWGRSKDPNLDAVTYRLHLYNEETDTMLINIQDTSFTFNGENFLKNQKEYNWQVIAFDGQLETKSAVFSFSYELTTYLKVKNNELILNYDLLPNFPNPFNSFTKIAFQLPDNSRVKLEIFNILGQRVITLIDGNLPAGKFQIEWDGKDPLGKELPTGIYIYQLNARNLKTNVKYEEADKMLILK